KEFLSNSEISADTLKMLMYLGMNVDENHITCSEISSEYCNRNWIAASDDLYSAIGRGLTVKGQTLEALYDIKNGAEMNNFISAWVLSNLQSQYPQVAELV